MSNDFIASEKFMNWKLLAPGKGFKEENWRDVALTESVQSCLELSIHLSVLRTSRELLLKIVRGKKYREIYGKFKTKHDWTFSGTATSLQFCS